MRATLTPPEEAAREMGAMQRCSPSPEERLCSTVQAMWCQGAEDDIPRRYSPPERPPEPGCRTHTRSNCFRPSPGSTELLPEASTSRQQVINCSLQTSLSAPLRLARPI